MPAAMARGGDYDRSNEYYAEEQFAGGVTGGRVVSAARAGCAPPAAAAARGATADSTGQGHRTGRRPSLTRRNGFATQRRSAYVAMVREADWRSQPSNPPDAPRPAVHGPSADGGVQHHHRLLLHGDPHKGGPRGRATCSLRRPGAGRARHSSRGSSRRAAAATAAAHSRPPGRHAPEPGLGRGHATPAHLGALRPPLLYRRKAPTSSSSGCSAAWARRSGRACTLPQVSRP